ncbi:class I SAM-dependent methyltransferase [Paralcaligenes sp. KSB-10]|uniref:class I SAM-dependent methyltransferase n=1 Tax=Paralcaligenes sp. KSB-10 TaxID=2901142 RepID=UPI001E5643CB|nr:class I SAM-dependent methyltransferase [Paralcaligenes sp. KSB-10]UHL63253.1 class I SAM-dependent methyltransferase [Paralcaligenes sp. KSB-10]
MTDWLSGVKQHIQLSAPDLMPMLEIYLAEATFGRQYITDDLLQLPKGARILEIGAGSLLLSCQLVREGFNVSALEPIGSGFSHFSRLRQLVLERANAINCQPHIIDQTVERLSERDSYDYAFSINVMEHVSNIGQALANVCSAIKAGAAYRFTCPNYLFPYEPHFNIPTFFSKRLTEKLFYKKIYQSKTVPDATGTWRSLNWINPLVIGKGVKGLRNVQVSFNKTLLVSTLERIATDPGFAQRRSPFIRTIILGLVRLKLHEIFAYVPAIFQPIIDCRLHKISFKRSN